MLVIIQNGLFSGEEKHWKTCLTSYLIFFYFTSIKPVILAAVTKSQGWKIKTISCSNEKSLQLCSLNFVTILLAYLTQSIILQSNFSIQCILQKVLTTYIWYHSSGIKASINNNFITRLSQDNNNTFTMVSEFPTDRVTVKNMINMHKSELYQMAHYDHLLNFFTLLCDVWNQFKGIHNSWWSECA